MSTSQPAPPPTKNVLIVGSGIFGLSTAHWMLKQGGYRVTIVDKSQVIPAPDAASTDINKILRNGDYADKELAALNIDAINLWREPFWQSTYHESGVLVLAEQGSASMGYVNSSHDNVLSMGLPAEKVQGTGVRGVYPAVLREGTGSDLDDQEEGEEPGKGLIQQIKETLSISPSPSPKTATATPRLADFAHTSGYLNPQAGWGEATRSCQLLIDHLRSQGVTFIPGKEVCGMTFDPCLSSRGGRKVTGVRFGDGEEMMADLVVVAAGAWTPGLFAQKGMGGLPGVIAAGQCVAKIQLTEEEVELYKDIPVTLRLSSGFYVFPPNPEGIMKLAIHSDGYVNTTNPPSPCSLNEGPAQSSGISCPRTVLTPGAEDGLIPRGDLFMLRRELEKVFPALARGKDFVGTRLCWYTDTTDSNWLIDWHPEMEGLFLATAGCGHAFKFLPNIGREILAKIQGTVDPVLAHKWRFEGRSFADRDPSKDADVRGEGTGKRTLVVDELARMEDLRADAEEVSVRA